MVELLGQGALERCHWYRSQNSSPERVVLNVIHAFLATFAGLSGVKARNHVVPVEEVASGRRALGVEAQRFFAVAELPVE